jgi:hypothetical protein
MRKLYQFRFLMVAAALLVVFISAGCQAEAEPSTGTTVSPTDGPTVGTTTSPLESPLVSPLGTPVQPTEPSIDTPEPAAAPEEGEGEEPVVGAPRSAEAERMISAVKADLAQRLGVPEEEIVVRSIEEVEWRDGSLGCPEPGVSYIQVITPGFLVVLEVDGVEYEYHTDTRGSLVLCEEATVDDPRTVPGEIEPGLESLVLLAKEDLSERLSILIDEIEVLEARSVVWPDGSLGCPQPGMYYKQMPMDGVLIRLSVGGQVYEYHGGGSRTVFLCEQTLKIKPPPAGDLEIPPPPGSEDN